MDYVSKALDVVKKHPFAAGVGATAAAAGLQVGMNAAGLLDADGPLGYASRFIPYVANALATAELNAQRVRNEKRRELTFSERMTSYLYGATAPMILWEGWEEAGASEPFYGALKNVFGGLARQDFPGKGSFIDLAATVGTVMAIETAKEGIGYAMKLVRR